MNATERAEREVAVVSNSHGISRRTVAKGAAWTVPVVLTAVTVPAYAASPGPCVASQAVLTTSSSVIQVMTFTNSPILATVSFTTTGWGDDTTPGDTGEIHRTEFPSGTQWNYIKLHHPKGMDEGDTITMKIQFTEQVENVTLTITDIDQDKGDDNRNNGQWVDEVVVTPPFQLVSKGPNVEGSGAVGDPFNSDVNGGITSNRGDVVLSWAGPLRDIFIKYTAADDDNTSEIGQHIGVGLIGFTTC